MKMQAQYKTILILGSLAFLSLQVLKAETACCGDTRYDPASEECCGGTIPVPKGRCCNGEELLDNEVCCGGIVAVPADECCGGLVINPGGQGCCAGEVYSLARAQCCDGSVQDSAYICCTASQKAQYQSERATCEGASQTAWDARLAEIDLYESDHEFLADEILEDRMDECNSLPPSEISACRSKATGWHVAYLISLNAVIGTWTEDARIDNLERLRDCVNQMLGKCDNWG
jgi:hypothetical protein